MTPEERSRALDRIKAMIPYEVFKRFVIVLIQVNNKRENNDLVRALNRMCEDESYDFWYTMDKDEYQDTITPIREIIDLLDGWILTATISNEHDMTLWHVKSIIGQVKY